MSNQHADHLVAVIRIRGLNILIFKCNFEEKTCHFVCVPIRITGFNSECTTKVEEKKMTTGTHTIRRKVFGQESFKQIRSSSSSESFNSRPIISKQSNTIVHHVFPIMR